MTGNSRSHALKISSCLLWVAVSMLLLDGCAATRAYNRGIRAEDAGRYSEAIRYLQEAAARNPNDPRFRLSLSEALIRNGNARIDRGEALERGGELELAYREYNEAFMENPLDDRALFKRNAVKKRIHDATIAERTPKEPPIPSPLVPLAGKPVRLKMSEAEIQEVFSSIEKLTGVTFIYDQDFKGRKISINLEGVTFKEALDRLMLMHHMFYRPIDGHTILIANDTEAKRAEYEEQILKTFYLHNSDPGAVANNLKSMIDLKRIIIHPELRAITVKDSPMKVEFARRMVEKEDMRRAEVVVDMEILEFNRDRLRQYGLDFSSYAAGGAIALEPTTTFPSSTLIRGHMIGHIDISDVIFSIPSVVFRLLRTDTRTHLIARPQIRSVDGKVASVKIGEKIPIPVTTFVPVSGGSVNNQPITSFQMTDIGLNIEITPDVHLNDEVTLSVKFEVSSVIREGTTVQPPTLGNRSLSSTIRLKDGETTVIAGLIRDEERRSRSGLPGISNLPILGHLLSSNQDSGTQTDIVMTLTPHIVCMAEIGEEERKSVWMGTERRLQISDEPPPFAEKVKTQVSGTETSREATISPAEGHEEEELQPLPEGPAAETAPALSDTQPVGAPSCIIGIEPMDVIVPPGAQFAMMLTAQTAAKLANTSFDFVYDDSLLTVVKVTPGTTTGAGFKSEADPGRISIRFDAQGNFDGEICTVVFTGKKPGTVQLAIDNSHAFDSKQNPVNISFIPATIRVSGENDSI